jgi:hypothetical protein
VELFDKDGQPFFMHTITDEQKDALSEAEKAQLLPALDPYDNKLVMPLKVCVCGCGVLGGGKTLAVCARCKGVPVCACARQRRGRTPLCARAGAGVSRLCARAAQGCLCGVHVCACVCALARGGG